MHFETHTPLKHEKTVIALCHHKVEFNLEWWKTGILTQFHSRTGNNEHTPYLQAFLKYHYITLGIRPQLQIHPLQSVGPISAIFIPNLPMYHSIAEKSRPTK